MDTLRILKGFTSLVLIYLFIAACTVTPSFPDSGLPVTHVKYNEDPGKLQFAIVSDLWGGYRPGIFEDAIQKIELLQPQFVMSVGDLIDGATYDSLLLEKEWGEFNTEVNKLSMPFFFLPGNHDIANPWMEKEWKRRFSKTYYYFLQNDVLFLCVNTEDGGASGIGSEQVSYFTKAINENPDARWIFVFMHRPVWQYEDGKMDGYIGIETALAGKNYTVFSGPHHTFGKQEKFGNSHYILGTTGGGSDLRGDEYGEFDHITWVTVKKGEHPKIINIKLSGMLKDDIVSK